MNIHKSFQNKQQTAEHQGPDSVAYSMTLKKRPEFISLSLNFVNCKMGMVKI